MLISVWIELVTINWIDETGLNQLLPFKNYQFWQHQRHHGILATQELKHTLCWYLILKCNSITFKLIGKQTGTEIVARSEPVKYVLSVNSGVPHSLIYPVNLKRFCNKCSMAGSQSGSTIWNFLLKWQIYGNCNKINSFKFSAFVFEPGAKSTLPILLFRIISSKCTK